MLTTGTYNAARAVWVVLNHLGCSFEVTMVPGSVVCGSCALGLVVLLPPGQSPSPCAF